MPRQPARRPDPEAPRVQSLERRAEIEALRARIADYGRVMYERRLTDSAGGNIGVRVGDVLLMSPRYAASRWLWRLRPSQIVLLDLDGNKIEGEGEVSREMKVHRALLREFYPDCAAVVHGHALNLLAFCVAGKPLPPVLESTYEFGTVPMIEYAPSHSDELAERVAGAMRAQIEHVRAGAAAALVPHHGAFSLGRDLETAFDTLERLDVNAYCLLHQRFPG